MRKTVLLAAALAAAATIATAQQSVLDDLPDLPPISEPAPSAPQKSAPDTLVSPDQPSIGLQLAGRGDVASGAVVFADPGERLVFTVRRGSQAPGPVAELLKETAAAEAPGEFVVSTVEKLGVQTDAGAVSAPGPGTLEWRAPSAPGWQVLRFHVEERSSFGRYVPGSSEEEPVSDGAARSAQQAVPVCVRHPFRPGESEALEGYAIGVYPDETGANVNVYVARHREKYRPPERLVKVTPETAALRVGEHFRLGDFSPPGERGKTHFIALDPDLVALLDGVWNELTKTHGPGMQLRILRAYMSPNERLRLEQKGERYTPFSRYQYGDGAAIVADAEGDATMSDLDRDGKADREDAAYLADVVERVKTDLGLRGGLGVADKPVESGWPDTPFVVVDLRGVDTRW